MVAIDLYSHDSSNREMCGWMLEHMIRPGDDIVLVHCIVPLPMQAVYALPDGRLVSNADIIKVLEMQDEIEVQMVAAVNEFKDEVFGEVVGDVDVDVVILNHKELMTLGVSEKGEISDLLCRAAVEYNVDALLIASTSRGGIPEALTGSVAASAARHSEHVPVVVYRSAKERSSMVRIAGEGDGRIFIVPVEDSKASIDATVWLADTVYRPGDVIVLIHIIPSVPFFMVPTMGVSPDTFLLANSLTDEYKEEFSNKVIKDTFEPLLKERGVDYRVEILLELSDGSSQGLGRAILSRADACKADLICIGSQSRGGLSEFFLGSVANYVDHHATMPVVVVH
jgi:nucleotide-binding universal stress UspA family protein